MGNSLTKEEQAIVEQVCKKGDDEEGIKEAVISWREGSENLKKTVACNETDFLEFIKKSGIWSAFVLDQAAHMGTFSERPTAADNVNRPKQDWKTDFYQYIMADEEYSKELAKLWFHEADSDHSGAVDLKEFLTFILPLLSQNPKAKAERVFHIYDTDGDGFLSAAEIKSILELDRKYFNLASNWLKKSALDSFLIKHIEMFKTVASFSFDASIAANDLVHDEAHTESVLKMIFEMFDKNLDGKLSLDEFVKWRVDEQKEWHNKYTALVGADAQKKVEEMAKEAAAKK